jgi:hypothetical protein
MNRAAHVQPRSERSEYDHSKPLREFFGTLPLTKIGADLVLSYIRQRKADGLSNMTVNMEIGILRRILASELARNGRDSANAFLSVS